MKRKPLPWLKMALVSLGEIVILLGMAWGLRIQSRGVNQMVVDVSELRDPSPFRAALMGHLGKIHVGLEGYLRSPDSSLGKQVEESRKDFEALLPEFVRQNPKLFPQSAAETIRRIFALFKESINRTLASNSERMERRKKLDAHFSRMLYLIDHNLRPLIRKDQSDGEERREAVLNIENQMRAWNQNLLHAWAQPSDAAKALTFENDNRGQTHLELYAGLDLLPRERKVQRELKSLWQANSDLARELYVKEALLNQADKAMNAEREQVIATLNEFLPAMPPAELETRKQTILRRMRMHMTMAFTLALMGLLSLIFAVLWIYRMLHQPVIADGIFYAQKAAVPPKSGVTLQMDLKGTITAWSREAELLYGYNEQEMRGQSISKLFESDSEISRLGQAFEKATQTIFETTHKTKLGAPMPVRIEFRPVNDGAGHASAIDLICHRR